MDSIGHICTCEMSGQKKRIPEVKSNLHFAEKVTDVTTTSPVQTSWTEWKKTWCFKIIETPTCFYLHLNLKWLSFKGFAGGCMKKQLLRETPNRTKLCDGLLNGYYFLSRNLYVTMATFSYADKWAWVWIFVSHTSLLPGSKADKEGENWTQHALSESLFHILFLKSRIRIKILLSFSMYMFWILDFIIQYYVLWIFQASITKYQNAQSHLPKDTPNHQMSLI